MPRDAGLAAAGLALAAGYYAAADRLPTSFISDAVGAGGLPKVLAVALAVLSIAIGVRAFAAHARPKAQRPHRMQAPASAQPGHGRAIGALVIAALYTLVVPSLGYPLAIALLLGATAIHYGRPLRWDLVIVSIGGAAVLWLIFAGVLRISMPAGVLIAVVR